MSPENPPGFIVRTEAQKAAFDNGFRIERGVENGWLRYASATADGESGWPERLLTARGFSRSATPGLRPRSPLRRRLSTDLA